MTEQAYSPEPFEREDPELAAIGEHLKVISEDLGFAETGEVGAARAELVRAVKQSRGFDRDNPAHQSLLEAYQVAAEETMSDGLDPARPLEEIGYQIAQARLWLELDDPDRFFAVIGSGRDDGVYVLLQQTPGCEAYLRDVFETVEALISLNSAPPTVGGQNEE